MEVSKLESFFLAAEEPHKSCFLVLRQIFLEWNDGKLTEHYKYGLPFYYFKGKPFCYLYKSKSAEFPYIGIVRANKINEPLLEQGTRKKMKILSVNPNEDIPVKTIYEIFRKLEELY